MSTLVVFEPGFALIAGTRVPVRDTGAHGEIQIGGALGSIVRPLRYGERSRIVTRLAGSPHAAAGVSAAVLRAALVQEGDSDRLVAEILALALAGAESDAPPFSVTTLAVARAGGWDIHQIEDTEASEIDRLAISLVGADQAASAAADDGWNRIVFVDDPRVADASLDDVRRDLAARLLARAVVAAPQGLPLAAEASELGQPPAPLEAAPQISQPDPLHMPEAAGGTPHGAYARAMPLSGPRLAFDLSRHKLEVRPPGAPTSAPALPPLEKPADSGGPSDRAARAGVAWPVSAPQQAGVAATDRRPINRVSYQPALPALRSGHGAPTAATQALGRQSEAAAIVQTRTLTGMRAADMVPVPPASATPAPDALPPLEYVPVAPIDDIPASAGLAATSPTLAQIEQLVTDEVADALAALLDHEADLRGIDP